MKKYILLSFLSLIFLSSCEKVIDVNLNSTDPKLVVEGIISNTQEVQTVRLSQTSNFSDKTEFNGITNATVIISDNTGSTDTLKMIASGVYQTAKIKGIPGNTYFLSINYNGKQYTAQSKMPKLIMMDTLKIEENSIFGIKQVSLIASISDPANTPNFYRFKLYQNNIADNDNILASKDEYFDGIEKEFTINPGGRNGDGKIEKGDVFTLDLMCIDEAVYKYFFTLNQTLNQNSASPANPESNIQGGCLGYFSAQSSSSRTIVYE